MIVIVYVPKYINILKFYSQGLYHVIRNKILLENNSRFKDKIDNL